MKNRISTLIAALAFAATGAQAQWTPSDKDYTVVGRDSIYGQSIMKTARTADGSIVLTYVNHPSGILTYKDPNFGYWLYMQVFDKNGNPQLSQDGKDGKVISGHSTKSWITDYSAALGSDGNMYMTFSDTRNDPTKSVCDNYMYCYNLKGEPVWSADGIKLESVAKRASYEDIAPTLCVSGSNIYTTLAHTETFKVKADSTNWEPNPWDDDDQEMPDSVDSYESEYQLMRYNTDGSKAWTEPLHLAYSTIWTYPAPDGDLYLLYVNAGSGIDARRIDANGHDVWAEPVNVESGAVTGSYYTTAPTVEPDGNGGLVLAYRVISGMSGYIVTNHLTADGTVYDEHLVVNGTEDGDGNNPKIALNGDKVFVAFSYKYTNDNLWVNQLSLDGDYTWEGDSLLGYVLDENDDMGLNPVKVIPQKDGWVVLYGNLTSWNAANFYVSKIGFDGKEMWRKQIAEDDMKSSGFSVVSDDKNAYIFYTCDKEIGDDWQEITGDGGMRVMCVDITTGSTTGIDRTISTDATAIRSLYNAQGMRMQNMNASGLYIVKEGAKAKKVLKK